jgi:hypothetical protein
MMRKTVSVVRQDRELFLPLLNLISTFIDGLAAGPSGQEKRAYLDYLRRHFPDLCSALKEELFYSKFRNGSVHEFSIKTGFAIDRASAMGNRYVETRPVEGTAVTLTVLNIDRLADDFERHLAALESQVAT